MTDDDWKKAGIMVRYNANSKFVEVEPEGLNALLRDQARLEWLALAEVFPMPTKQGWCLSGDGNTCWTKTCDSFRDAIDEAMRGEG